jgi:hypothetical protein
VSTTGLEVASKVGTLSADNVVISRHTYGPGYLSSHCSPLSEDSQLIPHLSAALARESPDQLTLDNVNALPKLYSEASYIRQPIPFPNNFNVPEYVRALYFNDNYSEFWTAGLKTRQLYDQTNISYYLELSHTLLCLSMYGKECPELRDPGILLGDYLRSSINYGPQFATALKKLRNIHTIWCFKAEGNAVTKEYLDSRVAIVEDVEKYFPSLNLENSHNTYDNFLNESYLILYDDDTQDFDYSFVEEEVDEDFVDVFKDALRKILPTKAITPPEPETEAFWISDSKTFDSDLIKKRINRSIIREMPNKRGSLTDDFRFCRTKIVVGPANVRDSWVGDIDTLYTIKRIAHDLKQIVSEIEYSAMARPIVVQRRMKRFRDVLPHYIMLDFKKAGLTFPHTIIKAVCEVLCEVYPDVDSFNYIRAFTEAKVWDQDTWRQPLRGTGLGNGNEIVTLAQCAVAEILKQQLGWDAIIYNDDGVWRTDAGNQRRNMGSIVGMFKSLGFIVNYEKTFYSRRNIFCEEYWSPEEFWLKKQQFFLNIPNVFLQRTTFEAKKVYHQCKISLIGTIYDIDIDDQIKGFWGCELHPFEFELPTSLGGWNFVEDSNLNSCLRWFENKHKYVAPHIRSHLDTARRFMFYLTVKKGLSKLHSCRIRYKREITEGLLRDNRKNLLGEYETLANRYFGIVDNDDLINQELEMLNSRSLKCTRPAIIVGMSKKSAILRRKLFKTFLKFKNNYKNHLTLADYNSAIAEMRKNGFKSFAVPEKFYVKLIKSSVIRTKKRLVSTSGVAQLKVPPPIGRDADLVAHAYHSIQTGKVLPGSDIFGLTRRWIRAKEMIVRSNKHIILPGKSRRLDAPNWLNVFTKNRLAAYIDSCTREQCDVEFVGDLSREFENPEFAMLKASLKHIDCTRHASDTILHAFTYEQKLIFQSVVYKRGIGNAKETNLIVDFILGIDEPESSVSDDFELDRLDLVFEDEEDHFYGSPDVEAMLDMYDFEDDISEEYDSRDEYDESEDSYLENRDVRRVGDADYDEEEYDIYDY